MIRIKYIEEDGIVTIIDKEFFEWCDIHHKKEQVKMTRKNYNNGGESIYFFLCSKELTHMRLSGFELMRQRYLNTYTQTK